MDPQSDRNYEEAIFKALGSGCNLIDTAINYRFMQSEKNIGNALRKAIAEKVVSRDEIVIATKGGFLAAHPKDYIANGICQAEDIVANCHCMTPQYLQNQLNQSLENLGLETVDIYYIHNPETQLSEISRQEFLKRMLAGFQFLEKEVQAGSDSVLRNCHMGWLSQRRRETWISFVRRVDRTCASCRSR